jgi:hypothetical protein
MSLTYPSVTIQTQMTVTALRWGQFPTISFTNGATAGSEVVTVASDLSSITVQIESGVTTMLQVKNAVAATAGTGSNLNAGDLISVTIAGGHNSDAVYTCNGATLAGGTAAVKATKTIGHLVYTAKSAGSAGNSTRIKYTSGATLTITVSSADITVRLRNDGTTTNAQIKAAIEGDGGANALVDLASDGLSLSYRPMTNAAPAFLALAGGTDLTAASKINQDLTYKYWPAGTAGNGSTITYTTGATAGSEVVSGTVAAVGVQISNGVSTATQIKAAVVAASLSSVRASGTVTYGSPSNGDTLVVNGTTFTKAASGDATHFSTIGELTALVDALSSVSATDNGTTITIVATDPGVAGNAITLAKTGSALTLSGAVLASGRDGIEPIISGTGATAQKTVNGATMSGATAATQPASPNEPPVRVKVIS